MSTQQTKVILIHGSLDETPQGELIFRGVLEPDSLMALKVAEYQRDVLSKSTIDGLKKAMNEGSVPDIELGMRGQNYEEPIPGRIELLDDVYIIDGLQRVAAGLEKLNKGDKIPPHIGAVVHLDTTETWERNRFHVVNVDRVKLSPNVLLRNYHNEFKVMELLLGLSDDKNFVMKGRVAWRQNMTREELITALTLSKVMGRLHAHIGPAKSSRINELVPALQRIHDTIGPKVFRDNTKRFFELFDTAWGIRRIVFKEGAAYMRTNFLMAMARVLSSHLDFWDDNKLVVDRSIIAKLSHFPHHDPHISQLASGNSKALEMLYILMRDHINSGKRTRRLRSRYVEDIAEEMSSEEDSGEEEPNGHETREPVLVGAGNR